MKNTIQTLAIKEIMVFTSNNDIVLKGTQNHDYLSFETQLYVNSTQLNLIINQLQKVNVNQDVSSLFTTQSGEDGKSILCFDGSVLDNAIIGFDLFQQNESIMQIRA
jgi:hypothetical protein